MEFEGIPAKPPDTPQGAPKLLTPKALCQKVHNIKYGKPIPDLRNTQRKYSTIREITDDILKLKEEMKVARDSCKRHDHELKILILKLQELGSVSVRQDRVDRVLDHIKFAMIRAIGQHETDKLFRVDI